MSESVPSSKKIIIAILLFGVVVFLLYYINIVLLVFAGILLAVLLRAFCRLFEKKLPFNKKFSLLLTLIFLLLFFGGLVFFSYAEFAKQLNYFLERFPASIQEIRTELQRMGLVRIAQNIPGNMKYLASKPDILAGITGFFSSTFGVIVNIAVILFIGLFFAADPDLYLRGVVRLFPPSVRAKATSILMEVNETLRWWLVGRLVAMIFIGLLVFIGLWAIDIPLAFFLGFLAGLLNFIPYIGPIISIIPAVLFAIPEGMQALGLVLLIYLVVQAVESYIITPLVQQKAVDLPPAYGIIFQLALGMAAGGFGVLAAGPLAAISIVLVREIYINPMEERMEK